MSIKICSANTALNLHQNENDEEAESLEGLQLYLRNVTRVWNVIWKVTFVQKFARDSRERPTFTAIMLFLLFKNSLLWFCNSWYNFKHGFCVYDTHHSHLGFSRVYKRKPWGECRFIELCTSRSHFSVNTIRPPFLLRHDKLWENQARKRGWIEGWY